MTEVLPQIILKGIVSIRYSLLQLGIYCEILVGLPNCENILVDILNQKFVTFVFLFTQHLNLILIMAKFKSKFS